MEHPRRNPLAHQCDRLVHVPREEAEPLQPILVIAVRFEDDGVGDGAGILDALAGRQRQEPPPEPLLLDGGLVLPAEERQVQPVLGGESGRIDGLEALEYRPIVAMTPPEPLGAEVRPAVVVPLIAQLRGEERELAERPLPLGVEQAMQPLARIADFFRILVDRVAHDSAFRKNSAIRPAT